MNEENLLRKRKYAEIVKESNFKDLKEVMDSHSDEFSPKIVDSIPLRSKTRVNDQFLQEIDLHGSIHNYSQSVFNPVASELKKNLSEAEQTKKELGIVNCQLYLS